MAAFLGRRGYQVELFERRGDPHAGNFVGSRSINLALSTRGIHALEQLGIADEVLKHAIPMRGRMIHEKAGELHFAPYDRDPNNCINSIGRGALNTATIEAAQQYPNVRVQFNHSCKDVDVESATAQVVNTNTNELAIVAADAIIHSDGWRGYDGLVDVGYAKHFRVNHGDDQFATDQSHINGIESFWSFSKRRLQKFNGVPAQTFSLHLKECEWRFNHRHGNLYLELLRLLRLHPL